MRSTWHGSPHNTADAAVAAWLSAPDEPAEPLAAGARAAVLNELRRQPKARLSHTFLYDALGSTLYEEICKTPEYFLTDHEAALVTAKADDIATDIAGDVQQHRSVAATAEEEDVQVVVEFGSGDGHKTLALLRALRPLAQRTIYTPLDLSAEALHTCVAAVAVMASTEAGRPLSAIPLAGDFDERLPEAAALPGRKLYLFMGSSLGNFTDAQAIAFLRGVERHMTHHDRFLLGVDTPHSDAKSASTIEAAYNDARGVTAAFTLNALRHVNRVAGLDFDWRAGWYHEARYSMDERAIVTHLVARGEQTVREAAPDGQGALVRTFQDGAPRPASLRTRPASSNLCLCLSLSPSLSLSLSRPLSPPPPLSLPPPSLSLPLLSVSLYRPTPARSGLRRPPLRLVARLPLRAGERLFVEQSRKFDAASLDRLCRAAGLYTRRTWTDADGFTLVAEVVPSTAPSASPNALARPLHAVVLASMRPHTGNAITAARITRLLPAATARAVDIHSVSSRAALAEHLAAGGDAPPAGLVLGVHAYRSGKLLLGCGVPYVIVLGGTDMNIDLYEPAKSSVIKRVIAEAAAVVAFNAELEAALLAAIPDARPKVFLIPQAVELAPSEPEDGDEQGAPAAAAAAPSPAPAPAARAVASASDGAGARHDAEEGAADGSTTAAASTVAMTAAQRERLLSRLDIRPDEVLLLLPAGMRPVKDVLWAADAIAQWHSREPCICLRIVGPVLDGAYAEDVAAALGALTAAPATARAVRYVGSMPRRQLHEAMGLAAMVLNTSESEGMCNSLLEAMLAGTPVLARANQGNAALIAAERHGLLCQTPDELVAQARRLLADGALASRLARAASAKVHAENSVAAEAERYAAVAQHALRHAGPPVRDAAYVGLHAPPAEALGLRLSAAGVVTGVFEALEVYDSIRAHRWRAPAAWLRAQLWASYRRLLAAVPEAETARAPGLNPTAWTLGHVAFTFDYLVAWPLRLPTPGVLWRPPKASAGELGAPFASMIKQASTAASAIGEWWDSMAKEAAGVPNGGSGGVQGGSGGAKGGGEGGGDADRAVLRSDAWKVYDSMRVSGAERWALCEAAELPDARPYLHQVHVMADTLISSCTTGAAADATTRASAGPADVRDGVDGVRPAFLPPCVTYLVFYSILHTLWHTEDLIHTRNMHKLPPPPPPPPSGDEEEPAPPPTPTPTPPAPKAPALLASPTQVPPTAPPTAAPHSDAGAAAVGPRQGVNDVYIPGGVFFLGAEPHAPQSASHPRMILDCEKWAHPVPVAAFCIAKHCVTNREFAAFVLAGGYADEAHWSFDGVRWLRQAKLHHPYKWQRIATPDGGAVNGNNHGSGNPHDVATAPDGCALFQLQWFDETIPLPPNQPVSHISYYEAEAFCAWAGRRLPTEAEWEAACCGVPTADGSHLAPHKGRPMPWGEGPPTLERANCGMRRPTLLDVDALPEGDSVWGVRQMLGNVWEWTGTQFYPYPGYVMDFPYREQSAPHFGLSRIARGGCFATPDLVVRGEYRSFYHPTDRKELAVGFRTCAL